jgi:hypothetical protein
MTTKYNERAMNELTELRIRLNARRQMAAAIQLELHEQEFESELDRLLPLSENERRPKPAKSI